MVCYTPQHRALPLNFSKCYYLKVQIPENHAMLPDMGEVYYMVLPLVSTSRVPKTKWSKLAELLVKEGADINFQEPGTKSTPLHTAVHSLKPTLVETFLSHGANPLSKKTYGHTPFLKLLTDNYSWTSIDTLKVLIDKDPKILLHGFSPSDSRTNFFHVLSEAPEMARDDSISAKMCAMLVDKLKKTSRWPEIVESAT